MTELNVQLLQSPEDLKELIYTAARTCCSDKEPGDIFEKAVKVEIEEKHYIAKHKEKQRKQLKLIKKVMDSGHPISEQVSFNFALSGVSRACTHQLVRHRHASFCQQSQRYVEQKGQFDYYVPESIEKHKGGTLEGKVEDLNILSYYENFKILMEEIQHLYTKMIKDDIPAEDARYVIPNAATSNLVMSLNLRELIHIANLRLCLKAQKEIRDAVQAMCDLVIEKEPWLADYLVPQCVKYGKCTEAKSCGRMDK